VAADVEQVDREVVGVEGVVAEGVAAERMNRQSARTPPASRGGGSSDRTYAAAVAMSLASVC
jgi:hypothetical protein